MATATFEQSDTVWLYFEPQEFERDSAGNGEVKVDLEMGFSITGPDGEELAADTDTFARTASEDGSIDGYFTGNFQPPIPAPGGEYTATLTVTDRVADAEVEETTAFAVEAGEELAIGNVTSSRISHGATETSTPPRARPTRRPTRSGSILSRPVSGQRRLGAETLHST